MKKKLIAALALSALAACANNPNPQPPTPPTPPPPEPQCVEGQACGCWHHPPEALGWLYACCQPGVPGGVVNVQDPAQCIAAPPVEPPVPPVEPPVPPTPGVGCVLAGEEVTPSTQTNTVGPDVNAAMHRLVPRCDIGSDCIINEYTQQSWFAAVGAELRKTGLCAGPGGDEMQVALLRSNPWQNFHIFAGDDSPTLPAPPGARRTVNWSPNSWRGSWVAPGGTTPPIPPDPTQPPVAGCSAPLPPKVWTAETIPPGFDPALVGQTRYIIGCSPHSGVIDCTAQNVRACDYCAAIGMGEAGGQIRCGCPVRNECKPAEQTPPQNFKCEERVACEAYLTSGTVLESKNGAVCEFANGNSFQFKPNNGNCRLCGVNGTTYNGERQGCGGWF